MDIVTIKEIARELKVGKDYALRLIKRRAESLGLEAHYGKRNAVSLSRADADRLIEDYRPTRPFSATQSPRRVGASISFSFIQKTSRTD